MTINGEIFFKNLVERWCFFFFSAMLLLFFFGCKNEDIEYSFNTTVDNQSSNPMELDKRVVEGDCLLKDLQNASKKVIVPPHQKLDVSFQYFCTSHTGNAGYLSYQMDFQYKYFLRTFPEESFKNAVVEGTHIKWKGDFTGIHELNLGNDNFYLKTGEEARVEQKSVSFNQNTFSIYSPSDKKVELLLPDSLVDSEKLTFQLAKEDSYTVFTMESQTYKGPVRGSVSQNGKKIICTDDKGCRVE